MNIFRDLVIAYNEELQDLCQKYHITYINTDIIGKEFNNSEANFHISTKGHNQLANHILGYMYERKIANPTDTKVSISTDFQITNEGPEGVYNSAIEAYNESLQKAASLSGYEQKVEMKIAKEHLREAKVFQKVMKKTR